VVLIGTGHPLAGIGPIAAEQLEGERIAVTGHRDGAAFDRAVAELLAELGVAAELVPDGPWPAIQAAVATNAILALTTGTGACQAGVIARRLDSRRELSFELLWRDEVPSPTLSGFLRCAHASDEPPLSNRSLPAVA
jgi:hypothetical protein